MIQLIKKSLEKKDHKYDDISPNLLYKNRLKKSLYFIIMIISALFLTNLFNFLYFNKIFSGYIYVNSINIYIFIALIISFIVLPYHPKHYGFNLNKLKINILFGFFAGLLGSMIVLIYRYYIFKKGQTDFGFYFEPLIFFRRMAVYPFSVIIQEALTRGFLQSYFIAMFDELKGNKILAILISSLVFAQFHMIYGLLVVLALFFFSIMMGLLYEKMGRSLVGVSIIHLMMGSSLLFFSNVY